MDKWKKLEKILDISSISIFSASFIANHLATFMKYEKAGVEFNPLAKFLIKNFGLGPGLALNATIYGIGYASASFIAYYGMKKFQEYLENKNFKTPPIFKKSLAYFLLLYASYQITKDTFLWLLY